MLMERLEKLWNPNGYSNYTKKKSFGFFLEPTSGGKKFQDVIHMVSNSLEHENL